MNKRYNTIEQEDIKRGRPSSIKNILHMGGKNIIHGDISNEAGKKNFLINSQKKSNSNNKLFLLYPTISPKSKKSYNISTETNNISISKYKDKNYSSIENESNNNRYIFITNHSSKNIYKNNQLRGNTLRNQDKCFLTSLTSEQLDNKKKLKTIDSTDYRISFNSDNNKFKRLYTINNDNKINKNFHISKIIKEIKEKYKIKNEFEIKNDYLAYNSQNLNEISNANNLLNDYQEKNIWNIKIKESNYHNFILNNKEIYKNNILSKLVDKERDKIIENNRLYEKCLEDKYNTLIQNEKELEEIIDEQKKSHKIIENYRIKLEKCNRELYYLKNLMFYKVQNKEAEIMKKLLEMEELRAYAKFVNNMIGNDSSIFEKEIYPTDYDKKIELNSLVKNAFKVYGNYLNESKNMKNNNYGNEPEKIYKGFLGLQDKIRYAIKMKDEVLQQIKKIKVNNKLILEQIKVKKDFLEKEYNSIKEEIDSIQKIILNVEINEQRYLYILAKELFIYILQTFSYENINKYKNNDINNKVSNLIKISELAEKCKASISEKEIFINESIRNLEKFEKENPVLFEEFLDNAKERIILQRQKKAKEMRKLREKINKIQVIKKLERINFIMRKVEHPFHINKASKINIESNIIKEKEDKELLTYQ